MEVAAIHKGARLSAQKARLVADQIRGKKVDEALSLLKFSNKKAAEVIRKVLESQLPTLNITMVRTWMTCGSPPCLSTKVAL